ncbi:MAG: DUF89 family protein [Oscillospiraceae bacterium]|nr:DUF89 family protein [Oscillospiraceae bacterium]
MSVAMDARCFACHLNRNINAALKLGDEATATAFAKELMGLYLSAPQGASSPWLGLDTAALFGKYYGLPEDRYAKEKAFSNRFVLERMDALRQRVENQEDRLLAALKLAILGNYIDFAALQGQVDFNYLDSLLEKAMEIQLDGEAYEAFCREASQAKRLLYLTDNAGEIGFDRIFAEELHAAYPQLEITFCVRGGPAANDATRADAAEVGIPFPVIDNGNRIAGTELSLLGEDARQAMEQADIILSKGQGNAETLLGCGKNIYYAFLVKCPLFEERFQKPKFTPMFVKERK